MEKESKFWKIVGIIFIIYIIIWFWPVAFHHPFFNDNSNVSVDVIPPQPSAAPGFVSTGVPAPSTVPDMRFGGDGYEDQAPVPTEPSVPIQKIACTMEAKQCPDGSYVGRQGPNCDFAPCPGN